MSLDPEAWLAAQAEGRTAFEAQMERERPGSMDDIEIVARAMARATVQPLWFANGEHRVCDALVFGGQFYSSWDALELEYAEENWPRFTGKARELVARLAPSS